MIDENATDGTGAAPRADEATTEGAVSERRAASLSRRGVPALDVARAAARAASDKKADDIVGLDLTTLSDVTDFFVIATGANARQVDTIVDEVEERVLAATGERPLSIEGRAGRTWILMDYGSVLVHVFTPEARDYYRLERLWGAANVLEFDLE